MGYRKTLKMLEIKFAEEMNIFLRIRLINYTNLKESLINSKKDFVSPFVTFLDKNILTVKSS